MKSSAGVGLAMLLALAAVFGSFFGYRAWRRQTAPEPLPQSQTPLVYEPREVRFSLTDSAGQPFAAERLRGRAWLTIFFFTRCPAACLRMNQELAKLLEEFSAEDLGALSITCDPRTDTPGELQEYAARHGFAPFADRWKFLTGDLPHILEVGRDSFNLTVVEKDHSFRAAVIDRQGRTRAAFLLTDPVEAVQLRKFLKELLAAPASPTTPADHKLERPAPSGA